MASTRALGSVSSALGTQASFGERAAGVRPASVQLRAGVHCFVEHSLKASLDHSNFRCCGASGGLLDLHKASLGNRSATSSRGFSSKLRVVRVRASAEETSSSNEETRVSTSNADPATLEPPPPPPRKSNPFAGGKISGIVAKQAADSKNSVSTSIAEKPVKKPAAVKPPPAGQLSANAAAQLNVSRQPSVFTVPTRPTDSKPPSPFTQSGSSKLAAPTNPFRKAPLVPADWEKAGARPAGSGKRVLDAFKEGEKEANTTKFGLPVVPTNIFDEVRRTPEEIAADAFKFEISPGQFFLAASFIVVIAIMFGTVYLVWKVGAIHYNEF